MQPRGSASSLLPAGPHSGTTFDVIGGAMVFAGVWSRFVRRGLLEYLLHSATKVAKFVR